jgi:hypothetical protein
MVLIHADSIEWRGQRRAWSCADFRACPPNSPASIMLDLNHRNILVLGRNSATLRDAIRAPVRREIKSHLLG